MTTVSLSLSRFAAVTILAVSGAAQGGVAWNMLAPPNSPPGRSYHGMASDLGQARVIVFGGLAGQSLFGDTWSWDGATWTQALPAQSPLARYRNAMAYDAVTQQVVLFGGYGGSAPFLQDTWLFNGVNWTQALPSVQPPVRADHRMVCDLIRQRVVLFGGYASGFGFRGDTWEWDGVSWTQASPAVSPPARADPGLAYDLGRQQTVLFSGYVGGGSYLQDTWEWNGTSWVQRSPAHSPDARSAHGMTYDPVRNRTVTCGGISATGFPFDTWEWDGTDWTGSTPVPSFPNAFNHALAFDSARQRVLSFGGGRGGGGDLQETSEYGAYAQAPGFVAYGPGCGGSAGNLALGRNPYSSPWVGADFTVEVRNVPQNAVPFMLIGLSQTAVPIPGLSGCTQLSSAEAVVLLQPSGGVARWQQSIPADPSFAGLSLFFQGAALNAGGANPLGAVFSFGVQATIGMW